VPNTVDTSVKVIYFYFVILYLLKSNYISISNACESNNLKPILERMPAPSYLPGYEEAGIRSEKKNIPKKFGLLFI